MSAPWKDLASAWNSTTDAMGAIHRCRSSNLTPQEYASLDEALSLLRKTHHELRWLLDNHPAHHKMVKA